MQQFPLYASHREKLEKYGLDAAKLTGASVAAYVKGEVILSENMPLTHLLFVVAGKAKVCLSSDDGDDLILCYYVSEGILGDVELMTQSPDANSTVIAITDVRCIAVPLAGNAAALRENLSFLQYISVELAKKLQRSARSYMNDAMYPARERLGLYLLQNAQEGVFSERLTNTAAAIGISYRHLMRLLHELCEEGTLIKRGHEFVIRDAEALDRLASE